jgi:hypothetical protein
MKKTMKAPLCIIRLSRSLVSSSTVFVLCAITVSAQSRIIRPQPNAGSSAKRQHVATLRASDSPDGSRVALSSDQSLNDYEAYRRGDRFYVKIPQSEVPRAEAVRGRGFADVKAQKTADSTVVSFRLQPGATAHVEQRGNKLDVVFTVAGGRSLSTPNPAPNRRSLAEPEPNKRSASSRDGASQNPNSRNSTLPGAKNSVVPGAKNSPARSSITSPSSELNGSKAGADTSVSKTAPPKQNATPQALASTGTPNSQLGATPESSQLSASPIPSPATKPSVSAPQKGSSAGSSPGTQSTSASGRPEESSQSGAGLKERIRYWILLAQLNPVPVAIGLGLFLLLIVILILQRRRARGTRRVRESKIESRTAKAPAEAVAAVKAAEPKAEKVSTPAVAATMPPAIATETPVVAEPKHETAPAGKVAAPDGVRRERVTQVAEQAKKLLAGDEYDRTVISSADRETRQLVGAELLTGLVGRDAIRRERAREAFMKHGYFDDATRDLRVAESPNERAAAARRLSFVHDREATPHLIGALHDSSPDVRRASVEALMDLRDPSAIGPLNTLMQTENDRKVPRTLIKHAIDACATAAPASTAPNVSSFVPATAPESSLPVEHEREVIEL